MLRTVCRDLDCATDETKLRTKLWLGPRPVCMYQDLSTRHDWPVEKAFVDSPVKLKGNSKLTSGNSGLNNVCDEG